jgi:hypothetical protein
MNSRRGGLLYPYLLYAVRYPTRRVTAALTDDLSTFGWDALDRTRVSIPTVTHCGTSMSPSL